MFWKSLEKLIMKSKPISETLKYQISFHRQDLMNKRTFSFTPLKAFSSVCLALQAKNEKISTHLSLKLFHWAQEQGQRGAEGMQL